MLDPNHRSLFTTLLTPPPGMIFDSGLTTTYTLDPLSLLTVPLHLAWLASGEDRSLLLDGIRLLEALQRVSSNLTVYAQRGRMQAPSQAHALYGLLESAIVEVRAPRGGAFHPKVWVLRFVRPDSDEVLLRLAILSRNLTGDRSWDLALTLEGQPRGSYVAANRELGELIAKLPSFAAREVSPERTAQAEQLADELRRTPFQVPEPWETVAFHTFGIGKRTWTPPPSDDLAIISPFVTSGALKALMASSDNPMVLVSRPDQLAALDPAVRAGFRECLVLDEAAETEDGEDPGTRDDVGLHAKAYLARVGWYTHLFVGSANATDAALVAGKNVEVLAELGGRHTKTGRVEALLDKTDFRGVLTPFDPATPIPAQDPDRIAAEHALDEAQAALSDAMLSLRCTREGDDAWRLVMTATTNVVLGEVELLVWPLSLREERAVDGRALATGGSLDLGALSAADVTGLVGFVAACRGLTRRFALNLPVTGLPIERDAAILRRVVRNREGFLRYLRLLLGDLSGDLPFVGGDGTGSGRWERGGAGFESLLEDLVRAFAQDRERLEDVRRVVDRLRGEGDVVPTEFLEVWDIFTTAMEGAQ